MDELLTLPEQEQLRQLIVAAFQGPDGVVNLDDLLTPVLGYSLFDDLVSRVDKIGPAARILITQTESNGTTTLLVQTLFVARPWDGPLREWVLRCRPALMPLVPDAAYAQAVITSATDGVEALRQVAAARADVRAQLDAAHLDLSNLPREINRLALYKGLHDVLHKVQVPLYRSIADDLKDFPHDASCIDALADYASQLTVLAADARGVLGDDILGPGELATETGWIDRLDTAASSLADAAAASDKALAFRQALELKSILRAHPPRLDAMLVAAARNIPFSRLIDTMSLVAPTLRDGSAERLRLGEAVVALNQVNDDVSARVSEHESWQAIEVNFWATEDAIQRDDADSLAEFSAYWGVLEQQIGQICARAPGDWVKELQNWSSTFRSLCPEPVVPPVAEGARRAFYRYVKAGRLRFYLLDKELKQRCDKVALLSKPLSDLITGVRT